MKRSLFALAILVTGFTAIPAYAQELQDLTLILPRDNWSWLDKQPSSDPKKGALFLTNIHNDQSPAKFWSGVKAQVNRVAKSWGKDITNFIGADVDLALDSVKVSKMVGNEDHYAYPYLILNPKSLLGGNINGQIGFRHVYHPLDTLSIQHGAHVTYPGGIYNFELNWATTKTLAVSVPFNLQVPDVTSPKPSFYVGIAITVSLY